MLWQRADNLVMAGDACVARTESPIEMPVVSRVSYQRTINIRLRFRLRSTLPKGTVKFGLNIFTLREGNCSSLRWQGTTQNQLDYVKKVHQQCA